MRLTSRRAWPGHEHSKPRTSWVWSPAPWRPNPPLIPCPAMYVGIEKHVKNIYNSRGMSRQKTHVRTWIMGDPWTIHSHAPFTWCDCKLHFIYHKGVTGSRGQGASPEVQDKRPEVQDVKVQDKSVTGSQRQGASMAPQKGLKACLHATWSSPCPSKSSSKFNIVLIMTGTLMGKMSCTPILSNKVSGQKDQSFRSQRVMSTAGVYVA